MDISFVVAMDDNRLIGAGNGLPWRLPADLKHFRRVTMGHPMVMGRRTWESIGRPLPGRTSIVVTRQPDYRAEGAIVVDSPEAAKLAAGDCDELMVIGGAALYEAMLPEANRIYLTEIHAQFEGDTWFPELGEDQWACVSREDFGSDERNPYDYTFMVLERIPEALPAPLVQPAL
jgi:dihydrofolate reductase